MARNEYYVDPGSGNDTTGDGSSGTPWATVQKAMTDGTVDAAGGMRINVKAGTADVLTAALTVPASMTFLAPCMVEGYTTTAGDGGIGEIDGDATYAIVSNTSAEGLSFVNMKLGNVGANNIVSIDRFCMLAACELHGSTGTTNAAFRSNLGNCAMVGCHLHNIAGFGAYSINTVDGNYFKNGTNDFAGCVALALAGFPTSVTNNIFSLDGTSVGVDLTEGGYMTSVYGNTFFDSGGSGKAIEASGNGAIISSIYNNYIEGFSTGIDLDGDRTLGGS